MAGATEVRAFQVTCPPGTPQSAPIVTNLPMPVRTVHNILVQVPPGPNGFMGFAIGAAGRNILPINDGAFIVASDRIVDWPVADQIDSGAWQAIMYNTGIFPHTIYIEFTTELPDLPVAVGPTVPVVASAPPTAVATPPAATTSALPTPPVLT